MSTREGGGNGASGSSEGEALEESSSSTALSRIGIGENAPKPAHVLAIPIQRRPLFPGFMAPVVVTDEALVEAMIALKKTPAPFVGVFLVKDPNVDLTTDKFSLTRLEQVHRIGTLAHIQQLEAGSGGAIAMLMAHRRVLAKDIINIKTPPLILRVQHLSQPPLDGANSDEVKATSNEILSTLRDIIRANPLFQQHVSYFARRIDVTNPYALADFAASLTTADAKDLQDVLETLDLGDRLRKALLLLKKEQQLSALQQTIKQDVEKRIDKQQRQYFLMEQLKSIKKELGMEKDDKDALVSKFQERAAALKMPPTAKAVFDEELEKLQVLERNSSEFNVTRTYLDWMTSIPWGKYSQDNFDLGAARKILDEDHYGMGDVKDRILEFIAVGKLKGSVQGKIICMVGPPGVGKTSIGKSIARALNRQFYRFSVGGLNDVAEIKGHRRTYIGAMPGKLIQCMKSTGVSNPLVLIDEIDKIGVARGYGGDPSSALLEMLDPNQNSTFMDHYLDTPVDASKVLFICTANTLDTIPGPLLDRMEIIRLSGYDAPEKMEIAKRYLDPKLGTEVGLQRDADSTPKTVQLQDSALEHLIRWYAREAGVRNLEKLMGKIFRKAAINVVRAREKKVDELKAAGQWPPTPPAAPSSDAAAPAAAVQSAETAPAQPSASPAVEATPTGEAAAQSVDTTGASSATDSAPPAPAATPATADAATTAAATPSPEETISVEDDKWVITSENLEEYVGKPTFTTDRLYDVAPPGVVMGLAWTSMGGSALYIEVVSPTLRASSARRPAPEKAGEANSVVIAPSSGASEGDAKPSDDAGRGSGGHIRLTGKMGDVMQESAQIAYTVARRFVRALPGQEKNDYLDSMPLHMHVPEGATPKDGPSAGITMITALLSSALQRPARPDLAMTGEVTLTGKVLPVGGIKEKIMAARRANVTCVVLPKGNTKDYAELPDHLKEGLEMHFAETYDQVYKVAFEYDTTLVEREKRKAEQAHPVHMEHGA